MWHHTTSLRFRLAAINFLVTAVILCAICGTLLVARTRELHHDLDDRLRDRARAILEETADGGHDAHRLRRLPRWPGYQIQVRDADDWVTMKSRPLAKRTLPLDEPTRRRAVQAGFACVTTGDSGDGDEGDELRVCTVTDASQGAPRRFVQVGRSVRSVRWAVRDLRNTMLIVVAFGLAAAAVASWLITGRMLRPLRTIARKADLLSITSLGERIGNRGRDEVAQMAASLDAMLERLQRSFEAQERFISSVSHELMTPLTVLLGQAQVLARETRNPEEYERFVAAVQDEARSLSRTVESLLTLAKAEAGLPIVPEEPVSINEAAMNAVSRCAPLADQREVKLATTLSMPSERQTEPIVQGDAELISLMIANLIRNAIRYAPPRTSVDVQVTADDRGVDISVRDRGPGIPDEYLDRIFDRFFQVREDAEVFQGVGLGLTITRGVAELHRGTVTASNHPDGGCAFRIRLPLSPTRFER